MCSLVGENLFTLILLVLPGLSGSISEAISDAFFLLDLSLCMYYNVLVSFVDYMSSNVLCFMQLITK